MTVPVQRRDPFSKISIWRYLFNENIELYSAPLRSLTLITEPFMLLKKIAGQLRHTVLCVYADITLTGNLIVTDIESLPDDLNALSPAILFNVAMLALLLSCVSIKDNQTGNGSSFVFTICILLL